VFSSKPVDLHVCVEINRFTRKHIRGLGGPRAGVDALCHLCCCAVVVGPFAGGRPSVFQRSLSLLVRLVDACGSVAVGRRPRRPPDGVPLQQACGFTVGWLSFGWL
jgi:hypothetical protein